MNPTTNYLQHVLGGDEGARLAIREIPIFRTASVPLLDWLFRYGRVAVLSEGEALITEGQFDQWVYIVLSGRMEVLLGGERVDEITASLVGERCVLGEPRRATLRASAGGVAALGIDMAMLDALRKGGGRDGGSGENAAVLAELLSMIASEVVQRVADLSFNEIDVTAKHASILASERASGMIEALRNETFRGDVKLNLEVYKYLRRHAPRLLAAVLRDGLFEVDTRALYARCIDQGLHALLYDLCAQLADQLTAHDEPNPGFRRFPGLARWLPATYPEFVQFLLQEAERALGEASASGRREQLRRAWSRCFRLDRELRVDLARLCTVLRGSGSFDDRELVELMLLAIRAASAKTGEINARIRQKLRALAQIRLGKMPAAEAEENSALDVYRTRPIEELVPLFSRHIIHSRLVNPYREWLARQSAAPEPGGPGSTGEPLDSLFE